MMRTIDYPTMVKDGSGWGAMAGISAIYLAQDGFTGSPAITVTADNARHFYEDLGAKWYIIGLYFKLYPVCRWAQPPVEAALQLKRDHGFKTDEIQTIEVHTFHEAYRLSTKDPKTTEVAQYSLPFSVAAALIRGTIGPKEVGHDGINNPDILALTQKIEPYDHEAYNVKFPAERWAHVNITLIDGRVLKSEPSVALGSAENPLSDDTVNEKFLTLAQETVSLTQAQEIQNIVWALDSAESANDLLNSIFTVQD